MNITTLRSSCKISDYILNFTEFMVFFANLKMKDIQKWTGIQQ